VLGCVAVGSGVGLAGGLISCAPRPTPEGPRSLTRDEARRLADMRVRNYRDGRAGVRASIGPPGAETEIVGSVDWGRELVYLTVDGPGAGAYRGLLQAVPGLVASRPADDDPDRDPEPAATAHDEPDSVGGTPPPAPEPPPVSPPADGWQVRPVEATGSAATALDPFLRLLFALSNDEADQPERLEHSDARWLGRDRAAGTSVDVLLGPAVPQADWDPGDSSPAPTALAAMGGAVRYWLDSDARLHRLEALLGDGVPVRVDLDRTRRTEMNAVAALGGPPVLPRPVTAAEAELLARIGRTTRDHGGATLTLTVPTVPSPKLPAGGAATVNLRGSGWFDWYDGTAYLALRDLDEPTSGVLLRADRVGLALRTADVTAEDDRTGLPPLPPPVERAWAYGRWPDRTDRLGALDVDLLVGEVLSLTDPDTAADPQRLRGSAVWLRRDVIAGQKVTVFELPKPAEEGTPRGEARMRYWVDRSGTLRRLELRTRTGAFAQLDIRPGPVPPLPWVPTRPAA
jgi:hypothetical protein